jgi:hypothetical protein
VVPMAESGSKSRDRIGWKSRCSGGHPLTRLRAVCMTGKVHCLYTSASNELLRASIEIAEVIVASNVDGQARA